LHEHSYDLNEGKGGCEEATFEMFGFKEEKEESFNRFILSNHNQPTIQIMPYFIFILLIFFLSANLSNC